MTTPAIADTESASKVRYAHSRGGRIVPLFPFVRTLAQRDAAGLSGVIQW